MADKPRCDGCRYWRKLADDSKVGEAFGTCNIRSVPSDHFPTRMASRDCGEFFPLGETNADRLRKEVRQALQPWLACPGTGEAALSLIHCTVERLRKALGD